MNAVEQALAPLIHAQHGLIARSQLRFVGVSDTTIERRLKSGAWEQAHQGIYRMAGIDSTWEQKVLAGTLACGEDALAYRRAAATLVEIPGIPRWVEILVPRGRRGTRADLDVHRSMVLPDEHRTLMRGIPVTCVARTLFDLAFVYPGRVDKMLGFCLTHKLCSRKDVEDCLGAMSGRGGSGLRALASALERRPTALGRVESDFEWSLYNALREHGVALPQPQFEIVLADGTRRRVDFAYEEEKLALEADSYIWHADRLAWEQDKAREHELVALGWSVLHITWHQLRAKPARVANLVQRALEARRRP